MQDAGAATPPSPQHRAQEAQADEVTHKAASPLSLSQPGVVRVRKKLLVEPMTCQLCGELFREATTISVCLHTFCWKCIYEKLENEGEDHCPVCDIYLGNIPLDKLRPDHNLQMMRAAIFPPEDKQVDDVKVHSFSCLDTRKESILSSPTDEASQVVTHVDLTETKSKVEEEDDIFEEPRRKFIRIGTNNSEECSCSTTTIIVQEQDNDEVIDKLQ